MDMKTYVPMYRDCVPPDEFWSAGLTGQRPSPTRELLIAAIIKVIDTLDGRLISDEVRVWSVLIEAGCRPQPSGTA